MDTYEKKYNEAQKWIESIYSELSHEQQMEAEAFFPELKESEDERIRKEIIATIHLYYGEPLEDEAKEMIAWLEKQGEQKPVIEIKSAEESLGISSEEYNDIVNDCLYGESKTAEKVEPKFHKGDWVVTSYGKVNQVIAVDEDGDGFTLDDDTYFSGSWKDGYHLWTIQDAKDGDVLQLGVVTAIFQEYIGNRNCKCYCSVHDGEFEIPTQDNSYGCHNAIPATKEQQDLLFQKMKEAGYKWDEGKKELRKIEQKEMLCDKCKKEQPSHSCQDITELGRCAVEKQCEQKPAWSEEDEERLQSCINILKAKSLMGKVDMANTMWLKSLKQRIGG